MSGNTQIKVHFDVKLLSLGKQCTLCMCVVDYVEKLTRLSHSQALHVNLGMRLDCIVPFPGIACDPGNETRWHCPIPRHDIIFTALH